MNLLTRIRLARLRSSFNAQDYYALNPDIERSGLDAWTHYSKFGYMEGRPTGALKYRAFGKGYALLRGLFRRLNAGCIRRHADCRILVHAHLYYMEAWCEMAEYLRNLAPYRCTYIVTYTEERADAAVLAQVQRDLPNVTLIPCPNRGFDVGPFLDALHGVNLADYDVVYHVHSKSIGSGLRFSYGKLFVGKEWFTQIYSAILGVRNVHKCIDLLCKDDKAGMVAAQNVFFKDIPERARMVAEFGRLYNIPVREGYSFIGGTCFAAPAAALRGTQALGLTTADFQESVRGVFSLAHAVERLIPIDMENQGRHHIGIRVAAPQHRITLREINRKKQRRAAKAMGILRRHGFTEVAPSSLDAGSGLSCNFFTGKFNGQPCFIKWGGNAEVCANEFRMMQRCAALSPHFLPAVTHAVTADYHFIASPLLRGFDAGQLMQFGLSAVDCNTICTALDEAVQMLQNNRLLHRDIRPLNVFFTEDKKTYLIDLQFMVETDEHGHFEEFNVLKENEPRRLNLGSTEYQKAPGEWDDAVSAAKVKTALQGRIVRP